LTLPDTGAVVYDILHGKLLPVRRLGRQLNVDVTIPKWEGTLIGVLPAMPKTIDVAVASNVNPGMDTKLYAYVRDENGAAVNAAFALTVTVTDPTGKTNREYTTRMLAEHGATSCSFRFALNDLSGTWTWTVTDPGSGLCGSAAVTLTQAK